MGIYSQTILLTKTLYAKELLRIMKELLMSSRGRTAEEYLRSIVKRRWTFLTVFLVIVSSVALYTFTATPYYRGTVQILIERHVPQVITFRDSNSSSPSDSGQEEFYQTQYKLLESRALAKKVAEKMQLRNDPHYSYIFNGLSPNADDITKQRAEENLVSAIIYGITVSPIRGSRLVNVSFTHSDPNFAALMANNIARCYIEQSLDLRFAASQEAAIWLEQKLKEARLKLDESEIKLNQYKRKYEIIAVEDKESITAQKLDQFNRGLVDAQTRRMDAETRLNEVNQGNPIPEVLNNSLIQNLKVQETHIIGQLSEMSQKYGEKHPRINRLTEELTATRSKIKAETFQVIQSIKNAYKMALAQENNLKNAMEVQKVNSLDMSDRAIQYRGLLRNVETNRALYENMLKSLKTNTAIENLPSTNIRIVYPATVPPGPVSPHKSRNLILATVLGFAFSAIFVLCLEGLDPTVKTVEEIENYLKVPNLAVIPHIEIPVSSNLEDTSEKMVVHHGTNNLVSESYRALRTSILFSSPGKPPQTILIASSIPAEGKTLTCANLATAMAKTAKTNILLVDADLRRPSLHKLFKMAKEPGLTNFLAGELDDPPVYPTVVPHLFLTPSGHSSPNPSELLGSQRMIDFLARVKEKFGCIILDSPPILTVTDAAILATQVEGVLLLVKTEGVHRKAVFEAKNMFIDVNANLLGTVMNDVPFHRDSYYYNYYYRYYAYGDYSKAIDDTKSKKRSLSRKAWLNSGLIAKLTQRLNSKNRKDSSNHEKR